MRSAISRPMRAMRTVVPLLIAAPLVAACGGGGGGGGGGALYDQWGLRTIKVDRAYERLETKYGTGTAPGSGQILGVIDSGMDADHPVFAGNLSWGIPLEGSTGETGDEPSHGTAVASVMAGHPREGVNAPRGVAWGAGIAMFEVPVGTARPGYTPIPLTALDTVDASGARTFTRVIAFSSGEIDFVNMSIGYTGMIEQYSTQQLRRNYGATIAVLAQAGLPKKTVFVWAAGNAHGSDCDPTDFTGNPDLCVNGEVVARSVEILPGLPARIPELLGHMVAVVAVGRDGGIASFSNRCGIAADWCIAAPGVGIRVAYFGPHPDDGTPGVRGTVSADGTSFAAPMVTGGLAVMKHYFRDQLSNTALVSRLYATADKTGIYAERAIYGQGLLDLDAATTPVGVTAVVTGETVDGPAPSWRGPASPPAARSGTGSRGRSPAGRSRPSTASARRSGSRSAPSPAPLPAARCSRGCGPSWRRGGIGRPESCGLATPR